MTDKKSTELGFGCSWKGYTFQISPSEKNEKTKVITYGKRVVFVDFKTYLDTEKHAEEIKTLVTRDDFENDQPGPVHFWPLDADAYNEYAKKNNLPAVDRKGRSHTIMDAMAASDTVAKKDVEIEDLKAQLKALQDATPSSSKKGGK